MPVICLFLFLNMFKGTLIVFSFALMVCSISCMPDRKQKQMQIVTIENNKLKCKRSTWNRQHPSTGYVNNVVAKREYKPVGK